MKWILRGVLLLMGAIFVLSLMAAAAVLFLMSLIRWLFTGRKPSILMAMTAYQQWKHGCWRRLQIDPVCRFHVTQRDDLEPVGGLRIRAAKGGSVKSRRLGQICAGANSHTSKRSACALSVNTNCNIKQRSWLNAVFYPQL